MLFRSGADPIEHYLQVVWEKTGSLIAAAARFGAMASGATADDIERLSRIGDIVGVAFQVSDDIIDISSVSVDSGKTPGTDLREGVHTLPVLYAITGDDATSARLRELLIGEGGSPRPLTDDAEVAEAIDLLAGSAGMAAARARLQQFADEAHGMLAGLPESPAHRALSSLVDYTIERVG